MKRLLIPAASLLLVLAAPAHAEVVASPSASPQGAWWHAYGDPALDRLVERALANGPKDGEPANADLAAALARITQARAAARAAGAGRWPSGQISGSVARTEQSLDSGMGRLGRYVPGLSRTQDAATLTASLGWDLDLAGGLRHGARAAQADLVAARAGLAAARLATVSEVVQTYLSYRATQAQVQLVEQQQRQLAERLHHARTRLGWQEGSQRELDERTAEASVADAALPLLRAQIASARHALAVLTGAPATTDLPELNDVAPVPAAPDPDAMPVNILRSRPDLLIAEARVTAAEARVGAALGEYWPHLTLGGLIGFDTNTLASFGMDSARVTQGFVGLRWRLFDFARVDAEVAAARGAQREALAAYRSAVLKAGAQVESSVALLIARRAALSAQKARLSAVNSAFARAEAAYRLGEISEDQLAGVQLSRIAVQSDLVTAQWALAEAVLDVNKALGRSG